MSVIPESQARVLVVNPEGVHARPCHSLVSIALEYECALQVSCAEIEVDGRSILSLMTLNAGPGAELSFAAKGLGAPELVERLVRLVESGFQDSV